MTEGARILVVEANETIQELLEELFNAKGYVVARAFAVSDAARELEQGLLPDVVVLAVALPDAEGRHLRAILRTNQQTAQVPVVTWLGRPAQWQRRGPLDLGANEFVETGPLSALISTIEWLLLRGGRGVF